MGAREAPHGISKVKILFALAKQAKHLGAYKLARFAYDKLQHMKVPDEWQEQLDVDMLTIHSKPVRDNPELLPVCYRCGAANALLNPATNAATLSNKVGDERSRDVCTSCGHPFVRSFLNFEILPLVEFIPEAPLGDDEALELIREAPPETGRGRRKLRGQWNESKEGEANVMSMGGDDDAYDDDDAEDLFNKCIHRTLSNQEGVNSYVPVTVDAETLRSLRREHVFCCKPRAPGMRATYYKSAIADVHIALSQSCHRFFHEEDFEFQVLRDGCCPYSRVKDVGDFGPC